MVNANVTVATATTTTTGCATAITTIRAVAQPGTSISSNTESIH